MDYLVCANIFETLGISWQKILLYLANFAVLAVGLTFLLYKPVKKFMDKRTKEIADEVNSAEKIKAEAEKIKLSGEQALNAVEDEKQKSLNLIKEQKDLADEEREKIIADARKEAEKILLQAEEDSKVLREKALKDASSDVTDIAFRIAEKVISREIERGGEEEIVDECIKEWKSDD